jgi:hypothetical protein
MAYPYLEIVIGIALISALIVAFLPEVQPLAVLNLG